MINKQVITGVHINPDYIYCKIASRLELYQLKQKKLQSTWQKYTRNRLQEYEIQFFSKQFINI